MDRHFSNADRHPDSIHLKLQPICQRIQDEYLQALDPTAGDHDQAHPGTTIVLITYAVIMMQKQLLFKEILTWYGDIYTDHLLGNFWLRQSFIQRQYAGMTFAFPLSSKTFTSSAGSSLHQGLVIGERNRARRHHHPGLQTRSDHQQKQIEKSTLLNEIAVFLFTSASAYNYFQFIYSGRILTFLIAAYI